MDELQVLGDFGFSKSEIKVYFALLGLPSTTSGKIIEKCDLQSSVVHRALKQLISKGIVSYVIIGKNRHYSASNPKNLVNYVKEKQEMLENALPKLLAKARAKPGESSVEMFSGKRAIFTLLNNLISDAKPGEDYYSFSSVQPHSDEEIVRFYKQHHLQRTEKKINTLILVNKAGKPIFENSYGIEYMKKLNIRYTNFNFPQGIVIFQNSIMLINWQESFYVVRIVNSHTARQFKRFFLEMYNLEKNAY